MAEPIRIQGPDGSIAEFPAGTPDNVITSVMAKSFPAPALQEAAPQDLSQGYDPLGMPIGSAEARQPVQASMSYGDQMSKVGQVLDKGVRLVANGATFGLADKFAGGMDAVTGRAGSYDEGVKAQRAQTEEVRKASPGVAMVAEAAGGLLSGAGLMKNGITVAGRVGPRLLPRILGFGAEGGAYGAAHGAGTTYSDNVGDYLANAKNGATVGALIGGALPVAGAGAGTVYRAGSAFLGPRVDGAGRGASALLRTAAQADEAGLRALPEMGPAAMLPDAGPSMLGLAQGAGTGNGTGRTALVNALKERDVATGQRLADAVDGAIGPAPTPSHIERGLDASRTQVAERYGPVMADAAAVDNRVLARELDIAADNLRGPAQRAMRNVREMLNLPNTNRLDRNPQTLLSSRQAIDGLLEAETNPQVTGQLNYARRLIDERLAEAVPGVKAVDAQYAELARQSRGINRGGQVFDTGKTTPRPVELTEEMAAGALPQGEQIGPSAVPARMRQGARAEIDRVVGTSVNDLTALERTFGTPQDWNSQKLAITFGNDARDQIADAILNNRQFRDTFHKVVNNSQTAQRMAASKAMEGAAGGNIPHDLTATSLGLKGVNAIFKAISGASNSNTKNQIGEVLARREGIEELARELLASAQRTGDNARSIGGLVGSSRWIGASGPAAGRK